MSVCPGQREFASRVQACDHIAVMEEWVGWAVFGSLKHSQFTDVFRAGPFRTKRDAVAWLKSWCSEPRPLRSTDLGSWHWFRGEAAK